MLLNKSSILIWSGIQRHGQKLEKEKIKNIKKKFIFKILRIFKISLRQLILSFQNLVGI